MASSRAKVLRSTRAQWKPRPAAIAAKRLMSSTGPTRSARSGRWPSIWQHWRPKLDRKTTQNAATAQMADASVSRHQSLHLPGDPHALLTCGALTVVATLLGDAG